jgi:hypothetical protein
MRLGGAFGLKTAAHPHDRIEERTPFHRSVADYVQAAVDSKQLTPGKYYLPLRNKDNSVSGYAQFRSVSNRQYPVLVTVLGPMMVPSGENLEPKFYPVKSKVAADSNAVIPEVLDEVRDESNPSPLDIPDVKERLASGSFDSVLRRAFGELPQVPRE